MADGRDGSDGPFVLLGTVTRAHGLRGEVKVRPLTESPASFRRYREVYLSAADGAEKTAATVQAARVSGQAVVMQLAGCDSREAAERLAGSRIWLASRDLPPSEAGEFYLYTLEGRRAETVDGRQLGRVTGILSAGGQDILVIRNGGEEVLVPAVRAFVRAVEEDRVVLDPPPGLLEINR